MNLMAVNELAKLSCTKWNKNGVTRKLYRKRYRKEAQKYWSSKEHQGLIQRYKAGERYLDTYPWPYCDTGFADWEENDDPENYTLISDQSNCVIRYSTSYVAWKIFEETGKWPQKTSAERLDAKRWVQFLKEAGYPNRVSQQDVWRGLRNGHHYVGILPTSGEWGIVVWAEEATVSEGLDLCEVWVSSYIHESKRPYHYWLIEPQDGVYEWVMID